MQLSETPPSGSSARGRKGAAQGQEQGRKHSFFLQPCQLKVHPWDAVPQPCVWIQTGTATVTGAGLLCLLRQPGHSNLYDEPSPRSYLVTLSHSKRVFSWITFLNYLTAPAHRFHPLHKGTRETLPLKPGD